MGCVLKTKGVNILGCQLYKGVIFWGCVLNMGVMSTFLEVNILGWRLNKSVNILECELSKGAHFWGCELITSSPTLEDVSS
jgi:hypothetical protein